MTLSDEQIGALLREVPLPDEPYDRYASVRSRGRARDRRVLSSVATALASVLVLAVLSALTLDPRREQSDVDRLLAGRPESARMTGTITKDGREVGTLSGVVDFPRRRLAYVVTVTTDGVTSRFELRVVGDDTWFSGGGGLGLPEGKRWVHFGPDSSQDAAPDLVDPADVLERLRDLDATVERQGRSTVRGVPTTRYRVVVPDGGEQGAFASGTFEIDIDDDGLMRRFAGPSGDVGDQEVVFSDFGLAVTVSPPPAEEVLEEEDLFSSGGTPDLAGLCKDLEQTLERLPEEQRAQAREALAATCARAGSSG